MLAKIQKYARRFLKPAGYSTFFFMLFSFFLVQTMPLDRFVPNIEALLAKSLGREVTIGSLGTSLTGGIIFENMEISAKGNDKVPSPSASASDEAGEDGAKKAGSKKRSVGYLIEEMQINIGIMSLVFDTLSFQADADALGGNISIAYNGPMPSAESDKPNSSRLTAKKRAQRRRAKAKATKGGVDGEAEDEAGEEEADGDEEDEADEAGGLELNITIEDAILKRIADLNDALPVPIDGNLNLEIELASDTGWHEADGTITISLEDVALSRKGYEADLSGTSMKVPQLLIQSLDGEIAFKKGVGKVEKFNVKSKHIALGLEGVITLADELSKSKHDLYLTFKLLGPYLAKSDAIKIFMENADTMSRKMKSAHRSDDYYGFRYRGLLGKGRFSPAKTFTVPGESQKAKKDKTKKQRKKTRKKRRRSRKSSRQPATKAAPSPAPSVTPPSPRRSPPIDGPPTMPGSPPSSPPPGGVHRPGLREPGAPPNEPYDRFHRNRDMREPLEEELEEPEMEEEELEEEVEEEEVEDEEVEDEEVEGDEEENEEVEGDEEENEEEEEEEAVEEEGVEEVGDEEV